MSTRRPDRSTVWRPAPGAEHPTTTASIDDRLVEILERRGVCGAEAVRRFLEPSLDDLTPASELGGLAEAVERLARAVENAERVAVIGDYDVDGVSSCALYTAVLESCGVDVVPIIPHRLTDGYGFRPRHTRRAVEEGCRLIVTADCGSTSVEAAALALENGVDVLVTDHHQADVALPSGVIEINPHRGSAESFRELAAAGLVFRVCAALLERLGRPVPWESLLRVASLGTIADMVPLQGDSRIIAALGLRALPRTPSVGLRALMERARVEPPLDASDIGFRIGPRLNAAGRMDDPEKALELLLTRDRDRAGELADLLEGWNRDRRETEERVVREAEADFQDLEELPGILVAWSESWHRGVVGIAAGRLARRFRRPALLFAVEDGRATGSGRSWGDIDLYEFLKPWEARCEAFGGHAAAIGATVSLDELESMSDEWRRRASEWDPGRFVRVLHYDLSVPAGEVNRQLYDGLQKLAPFGMGNPEPLVHCSFKKIQGTPRAFGKDHLDLNAEDEEGAVVGLVGWGWQSRDTEWMESPFEAVGTLDWDSYRSAVRMRLVDVRPRAQAAADP